MSLCRFLGVMMTDIDRLTQFIYLIADYFFYDATVYKNRVIGRYFCSIFSHNV